MKTDKVQKIFEYTSSMYNRTKYTLQIILQSISVRVYGYNVSCNERSEFGFSLK